MPCSICGNRGHNIRTCDRAEFLKDIDPNIFHIRICDKDNVKEDMEEKKEEVVEDGYETDVGEDGNETDVGEDENDEIKKYFEDLNQAINTIINRPTKEYNNELDILDDDSNKTIESIRNELKRKQKTMKYGEIWQKAMGLFPGWEDLGSGHKSECDIKKKDNTVIIELKNKHNTCNSGGKKDVERKLSNYKKYNPNTLCIWGIINDNIKSTNKKKIYTINDSEIIRWEGRELLSFVFTYNNTDYSDQIIKELKSIIHN